MAAFDFPYNEAGVVGYSSDMQKENVRTFIASGVADGAATKIGFGQPVIRGTEEKTIVPYTGTGSIVGITMARPDVDPAEGFANGDNVPVLNEGQIWVYASGDCTAGSGVAFDPATGGFEDATVTPGEGGDPDTTNALEGFVFDSSATEGGVVRLQVARRIA